MDQSPSLDTLLPRNLALYHRRLIGTRRAAGAGVLVLTLVSTRVLAVPLPEVALLLLGGFVLLVNELLRQIPPRQLLFQILSDWFSMTVFVHLTGGITSPALVLFLLHVIMVTILLPGYAPYLYVAVITGATLALTLLEGQQVLPHYTLFPDLPVALYQSWGYVGAELAFFAVALAATAYITDSIMQPLRQRERQLLSLYETSRAITSTLELPAVLTELAQRTAQALGTASVAIYLLERSGRTLKLASTAPGTAPGIAASAAHRHAGIADPLPVSPVIQRVLAGEVVLLTQPSEAATPGAETLTYPLLLVPIIGERPLALLCIEAVPVRTLATVGEGFVRAMANQGAVAIQNALAVEALQQADKQREQFVHIVTHELRAPVTGAQSLVRVLVGGLAGSITTQQQDILERLSRRMDALLTLINELLSLAASKSRDFQQPLVPVDLAAALCASLERFTDQAREKEIRLAWTLPETPLLVLATDQGLARIFDNLVSNAVKYTPAQGRVCVALTTEQQQAVIRVQDTGIGIPPEALAQIGQEFYRAPNARESGLVGTGLGLALVRQLIENFAGQLAIESEVGKGSTFMIRLPLVQS